MYRILNKQILAQDVKRIDVRAPEIAARVAPGQFVIVTPTERGERIPLTVADHDETKGYIVLIFQEAGVSTRQLGGIPIGENIYSILGPLGEPARIIEKGTAVCVATGFGPAQLLPLCRALKTNGVKTLTVIGARTKTTVMLETQMRLLSRHIHIATEDGSYGRRGTATDMVRELLNQQKVDALYAAGSVDMLEAVCRAGKDKKVPVWVDLNPVMVDGTGLCGSCRVRVAGKEAFACIEGPQFDGHKVDFPYLRHRLNDAAAPSEDRTQKQPGLIDKLKR